MEAREQLHAFLGLHKPLTVEETYWGAMRRRIAGYLTDELPPLDLVASFRCVVFRDDSVLVVQNPHDTHIWPGGRRLQTEHFAETAQREVPEEIGLDIRRRFTDACRRSLQD